MRPTEISPPSHGRALTEAVAISSVGVHPLADETNVFGQMGGAVFLVTGGAGFIGSHLVARLVERDERVRVLDNSSSGTRQRLADAVDVVEGDVRDEATVQRAADGAQVVVHLAAQASVPRSVDDPSETFDINLGGTANVLQAARRAGCRRVVFASTSAIYGDSPERFKVESLPPRPLSPYAVSKLAAEHLCAVATRLHGLETVSLRFFNVFGPGQDPTAAYAAAVPRFLAAMRCGVPPVVFGDGEQTRDFVAVDDVVDALLLAATVPSVGGRVFNVGSGYAVSLNEVLANLAQLTGTKLAVHREAERAGDIRHSLADVGAAQADLGFASKVSLQEGLRRLVMAPSIAFAGQDAVRGAASWQNETCADSLVDSSRRARAGLVS